MDLFRKCMEPVEKTLRDAKMDKSNVHEVGTAGHPCWQQAPCQGLVVVLGAWKGPAMSKLAVKPCKSKHQTFGAQKGPAISNLAVQPCKSKHQTVGGLPAKVLCTVRNLDRSAVQGPGGWLACCML